MRTAFGNRARLGALVVLGSAMALVVGACVPPPEPDPGPGDGRITFDSPAVLTMSIDRGTPEEPDVAGLDFTGQATGAWLVEELGLFYALIDIDDTTLEIDEEASPLGVPLSVGLSADQTSPAIGVFDPATGEGNLSTGVDVTLTTLDGGDGPAPIPEPCIATTSFDFTGSIDSDTGELEVSEENFEFTPMADEDCGGLGALVIPLIEGDNVGELTFQVGTIG